MTDQTTLDGATDPGDPAAWPADAGQFAARWNAADTERRNALVRSMPDTSWQAERCLIENHDARLAAAPTETDIQRRIAAAVEEQHQLDLALHQAYRPEVVAEVAVHLSDETDWEPIAKWCGGTISSRQDPSGEYTSTMSIPGVGDAWEGSWTVQRHDLSFGIRAAVEGPSAPTTGARALAALTTLVALKDGPRDATYYAERDAAWQNARQVIAATPGIEVAR